MRVTITAVLLSLCTAGLARPAAPAAPAATAPPAGRLGNPVDQIRTTFTGQQVASWPQRQVDQKDCRISPAIEVPAGYELNHHRISVEYSGGGKVEVSLGHHSSGNLGDVTSKPHLHSPFRAVASGGEAKVISSYRGERFAWVLVRTEGDATIERITHTSWRGEGTLYGHSPAYFRFEGSVLPYRIRYPRDYDPAKRYPLVVSVAGSGSLGKDNVKNMEMVILARYLFTNYFDDRELQCFSIVPQIPSDQDIPAPYWPKGPRGRPTPFHPDWPAVNEEGWYVQATLGLIRSLLADEKLGIDPDRVYYTGFSYGGKACWEFLKAAPDLFAAALCGAGWPIGPAGTDPKGALLEELKREVARYKDVPVQIFAGESDPLMRPGSKAVHAELLDQGGQSTYVEFPKTAHVPSAAKIWGNRSHLEWLFRQSRKDRPPAGDAPAAEELPAP